jgi:nitrogen fixation protein
MSDCEVYTAFDNDFDYTKKKLIDPDSYLIKEKRHFDTSANNDGIANKKKSKKDMDKSIVIKKDISESIVIKREEKDMGESIVIKREEKDMDESIVIKREETDMNKDITNLSNKYFQELQEIDYELDFEFTVKMVGDAFSNSFDNSITSWNFLESVFSRTFS